MAYRVFWWVSLPCPFDTGFRSCWPAGPTSPGGPGGGGGGGGGGGPPPRPPAPPPGGTGAAIANTQCNSGLNLTLVVDN